MRKLALVRRPGPRLADGIVTHIDRSPVDLDLALRQWEAYVAALHDEGWESIEVDPADDCPDAVFVEDTVVVYDDLAVIARPGADERRPETPATEDALRRLGYRIARIEAPETLDGGDVLKHYGTVWVGLGGRTSPGAVDELRALLAPLGARVVGVPLAKVLHLKSAVTALPDGTVVGLGPGRRRRLGLGVLPARARGARRPRRAARRGHGADVDQRTAHPGAPRGARAAGRRGRHERVREARGLRDLPVGAPARGADGLSRRLRPRDRDRLPGSSTG